MGITVKQAIELIKVAPPEDAILLVGPPGFGKSAAPQVAAREQGWDYWVNYMATKEAVEVNGLPHFTEQDGRRYGEWAPFKGIFPLEGEQHAGTVLICLDDLGQAAPSVVKAAIRCIYGDGSKRFMGNHELYHDIRIVGTSNLHTHRAGSHRFETYVMNRVTTIEVEPDAMEWCSWALAHDVHPSIVGYVSWSKVVTDFAPEKDSFMSPRSLVKLSRFVEALDKSGINGATLRAVTYGTIGEQAGSNFLAYHALAGELPDMDKVLQGEKVALPSRSEVQYMFVTSLIRAAQEKHVPIVAQLINRLTEASGTGFEVAAFLTFECLKGSAKKLRGLRTQQPALYKWLGEYGKYLPTLIFGLSGITSLFGMS